MRLELLRTEHVNMLACIRCGQCLTSCPTYLLTMNEAEGPRGRIALARGLAEGTIALTPDLIAHEQSCLVCDGCTAVCPAGVHMDPIQVALRAAIEPELPRSQVVRLARRVGFSLLADLGRLRLAVRLLALAQALRLPALAGRLGILRLLGLDAAVDFLPERIDTHFLIPRGEKTGQGTPVSLFAGCVMSTALAEIDRATIRVLERAGCAVELTAGQGCCGALHAHGGDLPTAKELFKCNIAAFERDGGGPIVVNSAGCGAMLRDYGHHLRDDPVWVERASAISRRVVDVSAFLAGRDVPIERPLNAAVTYQDACHLAHAQRVTQQPRQLLRAIPGLQLREMRESTLCCGSAGVYNLTNPRESHQLQQRKLDNALATGAGVIATANPGCLLQLQAGLRARGSDVQVKHVVELLDEASAP
ncbi:MAG: (Fe-S)-binding protein [Acidimicrobiia bacterium]|nr:(Fe-S)-binding protein [Acidimicrobiia bacterium]